MDLVKDDSLFRSLLALTEGPLTIGWEDPSIQGRPATY